MLLRKRLSLRIYFIAVITIFLNTAIAQNNFPELVFTEIKGAPKLSKPFLITDGENPIVSKGMGYAAPAFYDWDADGLKDLLIGEFATGYENGRWVGSFIRVYLNKGTEDHPEFTKKFDYARPPFQYAALGNGTPYSIDQFCCMPFIPQFIDINKDGFEDMLTGSYFGDITWFKGSKEGFYPGEPLLQEGNPRGTDNLYQQDYWLFSTATSGDLTGDGNPDLVVGGGSLTMSKNTGTASSPYFSKRELLLDGDGKALKVYDYTKKEMDYYDSLPKQGIYNVKPKLIGDYGTAPLLVDWDNDGVLDLLVTNSYKRKGLPAISFFKGVKDEGKYYFKKAINLFTAVDGGKVLPGIAPFISVIDWNNDGIKDLLIGCSVLTIKEKFSDLSWKWIEENHLPIPGKSPASLKKNSSEDEFLRMMKSDYYTTPKGSSKEDFMNMDYQGYIYIMLGQN